MIDKHSLKFIRIDNQVKIILNNAVIWDSGIIHNNPRDVNKSVELNQFFKKGTNTIYVEVHNAPSKQFNPWRVEYDVYKNGQFNGKIERYDLADQGTNNTNEGLKATIRHDFTI